MNDALHDAPTVPNVRRQARGRWLPTWRQALGATGVAVLLLLINDIFFFESVVVLSSSMQPTILPNERILLQKVGMGAIERFDVVVIKSRALGQRITKRVVALPGERVRLDESWRVFVNGESLGYSAESVEGERTEGGAYAIRVASANGARFATAFGQDELLLGPDEYFVLGDNRLASNDSRSIGPIGRDEIQGKLRLVWYSYDLEQHRLRWGRILATPFRMGEAEH